MDYLPFLRSAHRMLAPRAYLEIGVQTGRSLALSSCRSVGIDPFFEITAEIDGDVALFRTTSDEYFAREDPLAATSGEPFDLAFVDGLHLFEFAFRDFINVERHSRPKSVMIVDDVLPRTVDEAARARHSYQWAGDVYPMLAVLAKYRPDLIVLPVSTTPTGMMVVIGLDPRNRVLVDNYDQILAEYRHPDPQPVPVEILERDRAVRPERALDSPFWQVLAGAAPDATPRELRGLLVDAVTESLGSGFVGATEAA
jgi:hypothetical protein